MNEYVEVWPSEDSFVATFENRAFGQKMGKEASLEPDRRALALECYGGSIPLLLGTSHRVFKADDPRQANDVMFRGWLAIFSERAQQKLLGLGLSSEDFVTCHFKWRENVQHYIFLPRKSYDVVDFDRSEFWMVLTMPPPLPPMPIGFNKLELRPEIDQLPACFFAAVPGHPAQIFSHLLVSVSFRDWWTENGLTGANFKQVMF